MSQAILDEPSTRPAFEEPCWLPVDEPPMRIQDAAILLLDLGVGAVVVDTDGPLVPHHRYPVRLGADIRLMGVVTRCAPVRAASRPDGDHQIHRAILRFEAPSDPARRRIEALALELGRLAPADPLPTAMQIG